MFSGCLHAPPASRVSTAASSDETAAVETKPTDKVQEQPAIQEQQAANDTSENADSAPEPKREVNLDEDRPGGAFSMPNAKDVTLRDLADNYFTFKNRSIRLSRINCVDPGGAGFLCVAIVDGRAIRIEAFSLGAATAQSIADDLIGACKGTANLQRDKCRFDVIVKPTAISRGMIDTPSGTLSMIEVTAPSIEFIRPEKRRR
jgi:hypothetical protein